MTFYSKSPRATNRRAPRKQLEKPPTECAEEGRIPADKRTESRTGTSAHPKIKRAERAAST